MIFFKFFNEKLFYREKNFLIPKIYFFQGIDIFSIPIEINKTTGQKSSKNTEQQKNLQISKTSHKLSKKLENCQTVGVLTTIPIIQITDF